MELGERQLLESLMCPICIDYADQPVECVMCGNIFCKVCVGFGNNQTIVKRCPMCMKDAHFKESLLARKLLNNIPVKCTNCETVLTQGELKLHLTKCLPSLLECNKCRQKIKDQDFVNHVVSNHSQEIIDTFTAKSNMKQMISREISLSLENLSISKIIKIDKNIHTNKFRQLAENQVYYCGNKSDVICDCCDGCCGPTNGCLCRECMIFNCQIRNLPSDSLINEKGRPAKYMGDSYYCKAAITKKDKPALLSFFSGKMAYCEYSMNSKTIPCTSCRKLTKLRHYYV